MQSWKIGETMRTDLYVAFAYTWLSEDLGFLKDNKLSAEICLWAEVMEGFTKTQFRKTADRAELAGIEINVHAPFVDLNPGSPDRSIRKVSVKRLLQAIDIAAIFSPKAMVCHTGFKEIYNKLPADVMEEWLDDSTESWRQICAKAEDANLVLALENEYDRNPGALLELVRRIDSPNLKICFDTGHYNLCSDTQLTHWVKEVTPYLVEIHLHDNDGTADSHLIPGKGTFPFAELFATLRKTGADPLFNVEIYRKEDVLPSVGALKKIIS
jgi:sugar phosphate isomerase/epimerase